MTDTNEAIGYIVGGSLKESLFVRLTVPADQVQEGGFVTIQWPMAVLRPGDRHPAGRHRPALRR